MFQLKTYNALSPSWTTATDRIPKPLFAFGVMAKLGEKDGDGALASASRTNILDHIRC